MLGNRITIPCAKPKLNVAQKPRLHTEWNGNLRTVAKKMRLVNIRAPNAVAIGHSLNLKGSTDSSGKKHWLSIYKVFVMLKIKGQQCLFLKLFFVQNHGLQVFIHWPILIFCNISVSTIQESKNWKSLLILHKKSADLMYRMSF